MYAHGKAELTSKSPRLADGARELALSLGMKATVKKSKARQGVGNVSAHYRVRFSPTMTVATLPRKADVATRFIHRKVQKAMSQTVRRSIRSVKLVGLGTTRCISVDSPWGMMLAGRQMVPLLTGEGESHITASSTTANFSSHVLPIPRPK